MKILTEVPVTTDESVVCEDEVMEFLGHMRILAAADPCSYQEFLAMARAFNAGTRGLGGQKELAEGTVVTRRSNKSNDA